MALGLCRQSELDTAVQAAARKKASEGTVMTDDERRKLVSTEVSLGLGIEGKMDADISGLTDDPIEKTAADFSDADSFFNLPDDDDEDEDEDDIRH